MTFEYPYLLLGLLPFIICAFTCKEKHRTFYIPHLLSLPLHVKTNRLQIFLKWIALLCLFIALASPVIEKKEEQLKLSHSIVLLLDVSESMHQVLPNNGFLQSKFNLSKQLASSFIAKRTNDNIGAIVFGDFAYIATPLTYDYESASMIVQNLSEGIAGRKTAMYEALFLGSRLLQKNGAKEKVIILLSDGFNTTGNIPLEVALRSVKSEKIKVYTIGIGREGEYDEATLRSIAHSSQGMFFKASHAKALEEIYTKIDAMEQSLQNASVHITRSYYYFYPLILGLIALLGYVWIRSKEEV